MKWISEFSIQTEQSGPAVFSRLAITQVETDASQYKPFQLSSDKYFQYLQIFLVLNELVHECIMGTGPDNKRGRGRLAPSRVYYQGRFP